MQASSTPTKQSTIQGKSYVAEPVIGTGGNTVIIATGITRGQLGDSTLDSLTLDGSYKVFFIQTEAT